MGDRKIEIAVLYPSDPAGDNIGGIESFIRCLLLAAPPEFNYTIFGATTDNAARPVGQLMRCKYGGVEFGFFPLYELKSNQVRSFIPTTITYVLNFIRRRPDLSRFDVIDCHRIEQLFLSAKYDVIRNLFLHNATSEVISTRSSDMRWKWIPKIYKALECRAFDLVDSVFIVTEQGVRAYRELYPKKRSVIQHVPTSVNGDLFFRLDEAQRRRKRKRAQDSLAISNHDLIVTFVGRLDSSKNPGLLLSAFARIVKTDHPAATLIVIGDGVLKSELQELVDTRQVGDKVRFLGFLAPSDVAAVLQISDIFALSSAYEGMPISILEALSCGIPVVSTDVGAVGKLVRSGVTGEISESQSEDSYSKALSEICSNISNYHSENCVCAAAPYVPNKAFGKVYESHRNLVASMVAKRQLKNPPQEIVDHR